MRTKVDYIILWTWNECVIELLAIFIEEMGKLEIGSVHIILMDMNIFFLILNILLSDNYFEEICRVPLEPIIFIFD